MMSDPEAAIRAAYRLKDKCYEARDLVRLASTDLPTFHAVDVDGTKISHIQIWSSVRLRIARQVSCDRQERPLKIAIQGGRAKVEVALRDDYTLRTKEGLRRHGLRSHGWSDWVRTPTGWKQAELRFDRAEWRDAKGRWQAILPPLRR